MNAWILVIIFSNPIGLIVTHSGLTVGPFDSAHACRVAGQQIDPPGARWQCVATHEDKP